MKKVRITVKRIAHYDDLMEQYENPIEYVTNEQMNDKKFLKLVGSI